MASLRGRLIIGTVSVSSAMVALAGVIVYFLVRSSVLEEFDSALTAKARAVAAVTEREDGRVLVELDTAAMPDFARRSRPEYYQIWDHNGVSVARSRLLGDQSLPKVQPRGGVAHAFIQLPDGRPGRCVSLMFSPSDFEEEYEDVANGRQPLRLAVARDTAEFDQAMLGTAGLLLFACLGTGVLASGVMAYVVARCLALLNRLANRIGAIPGSGPAQTIEQADLPSELLPVVDHLNELLQRLDNTLVREAGVHFRSRA